MSLHFGPSLLLPPPQAYGCIFFYFVSRKQLSDFAWLSYPKVEKFTWEDLLVTLNKLQYVFEMKYF